MHKFSRIPPLMAAGVLVMTMTSNAIYAPPESPFRPAEGPLPPVEAVRPSVCPIQEAPPEAMSGEERQPENLNIPPQSMSDSFHTGTAEDAASSESPTVQPAPAVPAQPQETAQPVRTQETAKPEQVTIPAEKITALLSGYQLDKEQKQALCTRLGADSQLFALLEQGELTGSDLTYLALPNGRADRLDRYSAWEGQHPGDTPEEVALHVNMDQDLQYYQDVQMIQEQDSLTVLVNKHYALSAGYVPALEVLGGGYGTGSLRPEAAQAFRAMADAARQDGISLRSVSAYRSFQRQATIYSRYLTQDKRSVVDTYSARPGASEHQTGLALDINVASLAAHFERTPAYAWLLEHCSEYGFILRYPQGKQELTGYCFEPWHYRYVGAEIAKACMEQDLTYEEYLALQPDTAFLAQADT